MISENNSSLHEKNQKHQLCNYRTTIKLHSNSNRCDNIPLIDGVD